MSLKKIFTKYTLYLQDYEAYKNYKYNLKCQKSNITLPAMVSSTNNTFITYKHSGNIGDIIYALPTVYKLARGKSIRLYLNLNQQGVYGKNKHPLGTVMLNQNMLEMLQPLLENQPIPIICLPWHNESIDVDLDLFRQYPFTTKAGNIARWYFYVFGINANLGLPWLHVTPNNAYANTIVVARSQRYNAPGINYGFLSKYTNITFVGVPAEFEIIKNQLSTISYTPVANFLQLAQIIGGCGLFIGNQSFPYAIAEALKVKRILEVYHQCPNVIPEGDNGYDFCYQPQFEHLVSMLAPPI